MGFNYKELVLGEEFADLLREPSKDLEPTVDLETLGESLIANLNLQHELYIAYLEQANRQRMALVNRKLSENIQANVESERLIGALSNLEQDRIDITGKIVGSGKVGGNGAKAGRAGEAVRSVRAGNTGLAGRRGEAAEIAEERKRIAQIKCEVLYPLLSPARAERLKACRDALAIATGELKHVLSINMALVENGSRIIHTTIGIMTSVVGRKQNEKMNTYTSKGNVHVAKLQIRNLINRSV